MTLNIAVLKDILGTESLEDINKIYIECKIN